MNWSVEKYIMKIYTGEQIIGNGGGLGNILVCP
jgi:hypothetical protein